MPSTAPTFESASADGPVFVPALAGGPRIVPTLAAAPTFVVASARSPFFALLTALSPIWDPSTATFSEATGAKDMIAGSSILPSSGSGTSYLGIGIDATERKWAIPASTCRRLYINRSAAPGIGCSIVYTVRKNGSDTGIVVTLGAADVSGSSDSGTTVSYLAGDKLSIKQVRTGSCAEGNDEWLCDFQLAS